jgi:hypothetical protein
VFSLGENGVFCGPFSSFVDDVDNLSKKSTGCSKELLGERAAGMTDIHMSTSLIISTTRFE